MTSTSRSRRTRRGRGRSGAAARGSRTRRGRRRLAKAATLIEALPWLDRFHGQTVVIKYGGHAMTDDALRAGVRPGRGVPAVRGPAPGRGARRRAADLRAPGPARRAEHVHRRAAGHHAGDHGRGPDGAHRPGQQGRGRADQPARAVRRGHVGGGREHVHRRRSGTRWWTASRWTSAWSARSTSVDPAAAHAGLIADGRIPVVSSVARGTGGEVYNVNADTAAAALAVALGRGQARGAHRRGGPVRGLARGRGPARPAATGNVISQLDRDRAWSGCCPA